MSREIKNQKAILNKLNIEALNEMQVEAQHAIHSSENTILLSPTGTGKTLAFLLPIFAELNPDLMAVQALIIVPSRELAIQIEQVAREMGTGFKINAAYGGRSVSKDKLELEHPPALLVGTPGRIADHIHRETFGVDNIKTLVLDEFDKSLEVGFEEDMIEIVDAVLPNLTKKILTSATHGVEIPQFVCVENPTIVDYLGTNENRLVIKSIVSPDKDKMQTLVDALYFLGNQPGIIFCNFKDTIQRVSDYLLDHKIPHGQFYGGLEQRDRERALIKFRNGTHQILLATDLAARGIDVPEIKFIIHYHLPHHEEEFTHRNGRTARMKSDGTAYVLHWKNENLPDFIEDLEQENILPAPPPEPSKWKTLFISGGRQDKVSKGDIAGFLFKEGKLNKNEVGIIELKNDCAFVAIHYKKIKKVVQDLNDTHIKKRKVRLKII